PAQVVGRVAADAAFEIERFAALRLLVGVDALPDGFQILSGSDGGGHGEDNGNDDGSHADGGKRGQANSTLSEEDQASRTRRAARRRGRPQQLRPASAAAIPDRDGSRTTDVPASTSARA